MCHRGVLPDAALPCSPPARARSQRAQLVAAAPGQARGRRITWGLRRPRLLQPWLRRQTPLSPAVKWWPPPPLLPRRFSGTLLPGMLCAVAGRCRPAKARASRPSWRVAPLSARLLLWAAVAPRSAALALCRRAAALAACLTAALRWARPGPFCGHMAHSAWRLCSIAQHLTATVLPSRLAPQGLPRARRHQPQKAQRKATQYADLCLTAVRHLFRQGGQTNRLVVLQRGAAPPTACRTQVRDKQWIAARRPSGVEANAPGGKSPKRGAGAEGAPGHLRLAFTSEAPASTTCLMSTPRCTNWSSRWP